MLNDLSLQTRLALFVQMLGPGLMLGSIFAIGDEAYQVVGILLGLGAAVTIGGAVAFSFWTYRSNRVLLDLLSQRSAEMVHGAVVGVPAIGRVRRRRIARRSPAFLASQASALPAPAVVLVVTVLARAEPDVSGHWCPDW